MSEPSISPIRRLWLDTPHLSFPQGETERALWLSPGFSDVSLFYVGFAFRGWLAYAKYPPSDSLLTDP